PIFASRVAPPEPERPTPASRRAIFFDVENTSRAQHIAHVIDHLQVDRRGYRTEFFAVGNWRVIGHDTARLLAGHGAHLVHRPPAAEAAADRGAPADDGGGPRSRDRRARRGGRGASPAPARHAPPPPYRPEPPRPVSVGDGEEPHTAPHDEIVTVVRELMRAS